MAPMNLNLLWQNPKEHEVSRPVYSQQAVRDLAYKLWQEAGEPPNATLYFWLEAERQLEQTTGSGSACQERR